MVPEIATDIAVHVEDSHWPEKPHQVRVSYMWYGQAMSWVRYYTTRDAAVKASKRPIR